MNIIANLFLIVVVYILSGSPYVTIHGEIKNIIYFGILLLAYYSFKKRKTNISKKTAKLGVLILFFSTFTLLSCLIHNESFSPYLRICATFIFSFLLTQYFDCNDFFRLYCIFIKRISIICLFLYIILQFVGSFDFLPEYSNTNGVIYKIGIVFNYIKSVPIRNCCIFWEPGIYATHLLISIIIEKFYFNKVSRFDFVLYHVCVLSTFSSAGIVLIVILDIIFFYKLLIDLEKNNLFSYLFVFVLIPILLVVWFNSDSILRFFGADQHEFYYKLMRTSFSNSLRIQAIINNIKMAKTSPLFGIGIEEAYRHAIYVEDTSTSTFLVSEVGIVGIIPTLIVIFGSKRLHNNHIISISLMFIFLCIINKEPHSGMVIIWIIFMYYLQNNNATNINKGERVDYA